MTPSSPTNSPSAPNVIDLLSTHKPKSPGPGFFDVKYRDLPALAKAFLEGNGLMATSDDTSYNDTHVRSVTRSLQLRLYRTLQGVTEALVLRSIQAAHILRSLHAHQESVDEAEVDRILKAIDAEVREVLVPEFNAHLDDAMEELDVLVWYEVYIRRGGEHQVSDGEALREHRNLRVRMLIENVVDMVRQMEGSVRRALGWEEEAENTKLEEETEMEEYEVVESSSDSESEAFSDFGDDGDEQFEGASGKDKEVLATSPVRYQTLSLSRQVSSFLVQNFGFRLG